GVIGYGYWGPNLVRNFGASEHFELVAVAERSAALRKAAIKAYPVAQVMEDGSELIAHSDIDAVAIATPVASHFELAPDALNARKHVLVEKPWWPAVAEAEALVSQAERMQGVLMVTPPFLFTGAVQTIPRLIREGQLGRICYFDSMRVNLGLFQPDIN